MAYDTQMGTKSVTVTAAQLKSLNTVPVVIIPAVAGCYIKLRSVLFIYTFGTVAFNAGVNDGIGLIVGTLPNTFFNFTAQTEAASLLGSGNYFLWGSQTMIPNPNAVSLPPADVVNQPVSLFQRNTAGSWPTGTNWTTGDGALTVKVRYTLVEVAA